MTRKDYILLSDTFRAYFAARKYRMMAAGIDHEIAQEEICLAIGLALEKDNPAFDLKHFLTECGL